MNASQIVVNHDVFRQALNGGPGGPEGAEGLESTGPGPGGDFFESLRPVLQGEGETRPEEGVGLVRDAFARLVQEEKDPGVFASVQDQLASLIQSELAERGMELQRGVPAPTGGFEVQFD